jgi:hypothetical protein
VPGKLGLLGPPIGLGPPLLLAPPMLLDPLSPGRRKGTIGFWATCTGRSDGACAIWTAGTAKGGRRSSNDAPQLPHVRHPQSNTRSPHRSADAQIFAQVMPFSDHVLTFRDHVITI